MNKDGFQLGLIQMQVPGQADQAVQKAVEKIREAAQGGAQVICLPELFESPYFCQTEDDRLFDLAKPIKGPLLESFSQLAAELGVVIVAPVFEKQMSGVYYNSAFVVDTDGSLAGTYRKMHIPDDPAYYEKYYFTPGDKGFKPIQTAYGKIGVLICWDQWFPEAARLMALAGADCLVYPTAIGWHPQEKAAFGKTQFEAWQTVQRGHAIANGIYVGSVNRLGFEKRNPSGEGIEFWGQSFICGPQGELLVEAPVGEDKILIQPVSFTHAETVRRHWPFLRDRRIDAYKGLVERSL